MVGELSVLLLWMWVPGDTPTSLYFMFSCLLSRSVAGTRQLPLTTPRRTLRKSGVGWVPGRPVWSHQREPPSSFVRLLETGTMI